METVARRLSGTAPAKINYGLRVVATRADGYHELESLFLPLDLCDDIAIELVAGGPPAVEVDVAGLAAGVPSDSSNLAARAASAFVGAADLRSAVRLRILKRIPNGAGLGGGSSDAGAVLRALRDALPGAVSPARLARIALALGADVPFFLHPQPSWATGVGERLEPVRGAPALPVLLANPGAALSTARVFRAFDEAPRPTLTPAAGDRTIRPPRSPGGLAGGLRWERVVPRERIVHNDLEAAAVALCPAVATLIEQVRRQDPVQVGMSGSGPTVYGVFESLAQAKSALERIGFDRSTWARVATTIGSR